MKQAKKRLLPVRSLSVVTGPSGEHTHCGKVDGTHKDCRLRLEGCTWKEVPVPEAMQKR